MEISFNLPDSIHLSGEYVILKPNISEEQFWEIANEDANFELIDGVLVIHSPASTEHEQIFHYLSQLFSIFIDEPKKGQVLGSRLVMRLSEKWNPEPDLMVIMPENYSKIETTRINGPADIVVEILSDSTRDLDLNKKIPQYLTSGVKEIWVIDPSEKIISIYNQASRRIYNNPESDTEIQSEIIKEIKIFEKWIWHRSSFPAVKIIKDYLKDEQF
jgi:Uma2 family endonuclease